MSNTGRGIIYLSLASMIFMVSGYAVNLVLGKYLGPAEYGAYGLTLALITIVNLVQTSGIPQAVSKYIAERPSQADGILKSGLILQSTLTMTLTAGLFVSAPLLADAFHDRTLVSHIRLASLILPAYGLFALYLGYYNGQHRFGRQAYVNTVYAASKIVLILSLGLTFRLTGALLGFVIAPLIALAAGFHLPRASAKDMPVGGIVRLSVPLVLFAASLTVLETVDLFFLKAIRRSAEETGYETAVHNVTLIPSYARAALSTLRFPTISTSFGSGDADSSRAYIRKGVRYLLLLLLPAVTVMSVTSDRLMRLLYGPAYAPGAPAMSVLVFGVGCLVVYTMLANILNSTGNVRTSVLEGSAGLFLTVLFCVLLIPQFGMSGAAWATTIGCAAALSLSSRSVFLKFGVLADWQSVLRILAATAAVTAAATFIAGPPVLLPVWYAALGVLYFAVLSLTGELRESDRQMLANIMRRYA